MPTQQGRLEASLTVPEYGVGFVPLHTQPSTIGYYAVYNYSYGIVGATGGNTVNDEFQRTVANGWGTADTGQMWTIISGAAANYSVAVGQGTVNLPTIGDAATRHNYLVPVSIVNPDISAVLSTDQVALTASAISSVTARSDGTGANLYCARLIWGLTGALSLQINKVVATVETNIVASVPVGTYTANSLWNLRFTLNGTSIQAKAWAVGTTEPSAYQAIVTDSSLTGAGSVGTRTSRGGANTNVSPNFFYDSFGIDNMFTDSVRAVYMAPQRFGEMWSIERIAVNDTSLGQVPGAFFMRGLVRPDTAFNFSAITFPHQVPPLLANSQLIDASANGTSDVDDLSSPFQLGGGEWLSVLFAAAQTPAPNTIQTSSVFLTGQAYR